MPKLNAQFKKMSTVGLMKNKLSVYYSHMKSPNKEVLAALLAYAKKNKLNQVALAELLGEPNSATITNWKSRGLPDAKVLAVANRIGYSLQSTQQEQEVGSGPAIKSTVPLISWVQAGPYAAATEPEDLRVCEPIDTTVRVGARGFALRVESTSMAPEFPPGTIIIVDPDLEPRPGDYVIVANGAAEATFKQLIKDGSDWYLRPINPQFQAQRLPEGYRIVGVVVASERRYR